MTGWRFYPLAGFPKCGVLVSNEGKPAAAIFLTPDQAKARREIERQPLK